MGSAAPRFLGLGNQHAAVPSLVRTPASTAVLPQAGRQIMWSARMGMTVAKTVYPGAALPSRIVLHRTVTFVRRPAATQPLDIVYCTNTTLPYHVCSSPSFRPTLFRAAPMPPGTSGGASCSIGGRADPLHATPSTFRCTAANGIPSTGPASTTSTSRLHRRLAFAFPPALRTPTRRYSTVGLFSAAAAALGYHDQAGGSSCVYMPAGAVGALRLTLTVRLSILPSLPAAVPRAGLRAIYRAAIASGARLESGGS